MKQLPLQVWLQQWLAKARYFSRNAWQFLRLLFSHCWQDQCTQVAAALTYTASLALVPVLAVGFALFSTFPIFPDLLATIQNYAFEIFMPGVREDVQASLLAFAQKSAGLTSIGLVALVITALMTLKTIDNAINRIWRVEHARRTWLRLLIYIAILVVGPVVIGTSLLLSTYLVSLPYISTVAHLPDVQSGFYTLLPFVVTWLLFSFLYHWVPNARVAWKHSFSGGLVAAALFELAKQGFALYIAWFPTYEVVYGALAIVPLTLVWIYLLWMVVLFGAEVTYSIGCFSWNKKNSTANSAD